MDARRRRNTRRPSALTVTAVAIGAALAVNLATSTVQIAWLWWPEVTWLLVLILFFAAWRIERARSLAENAEGISIHRMDVFSRMQVDGFPAMRSRILDRVKKYEFDGPRARPLPQRIIDLDILEEPYGHDAAPISNRAIPRRNSIKDIYKLFDSSDGVLLILGPAGSGKTTLLRLLLDSLLHTAYSHRDKATPFLLDLTSWNDGSDFSAWFVNALKARYEIDESLGRDIAGSNNIVILADGLDALPPRSRIRCVEEINRFRTEHGLTSIVVTCRTIDYDELPIRLSLQYAVVLQSASRQQVLEQVRFVGESFENDVTNNPQLASLLTEPLALALAIESGAAGTLEGQGAPTTSRGLIQIYLKRMLNQITGEAHLETDVCLEYLSWIASRLERTNSSSFRVELIQPTDLPSRSLRRIARLIVMLPVALLSWAGLGLLAAGSVGPSAAILAGGLAAVTIGAIASQREVWLQEPYGFSLLGRREFGAHLWTRGITACWAMIALSILFALISVALGWPLIFILTGHASSALLGAKLAVIAASFIGIAGGLIVSVFTVTLPEQSGIPNQAVWRTGRHALLVGVPTALVYAGVIGTRWPGGIAIFVGLWVGIVATLGAGGWSFLQHFVIRFLLSKKDVMPYQMVKFLEIASRTTLVYRVGGGYVFRHPLIVDEILNTSRAEDLQVRDRHAENPAVRWLPATAGGRVLADLAPAAGTLEDAATLSERLGGLPLALHQAGTYLASEFAVKKTFVSYLRALDEQDQLGSGDAHAIVTSTQEVSLDTLAARGRPQARLLLRALCCLAPATVIPTVLLDLPVPRASGQSQDETVDGLNALVSVGLITLQSDQTGARSGVTVDPLVAETNRLRLNAENPALTGRVAVGLLAAAAGRISYDHPADWPAWQQLVPHENAVYGYLAGKLKKADLIRLARVTCDTASALMWSGSYRASQDAAQTALSHTNRLGNHPVVRNLRFRLASAYGAGGRHAEAEQELREILAAQRRVFRRNRRNRLNMLATRAEIAGQMKALGRDAEAEQEYRDIVAAQRRALPADDSAVLGTRYEIASILAARGQHAEAEQEYIQILEAYRRSSRPDHPDTFTIRCQIAQQRSELGQHAEAERDYRDILADQIRVLGPNHPSTLNTRTQAALLLGEHEQYAQAEHEFREIFAARLQLVGSDHPDALDARHQIAWYRALQGHYAEAEREFRAVLADQLRVLGPDDPRTLSTRSEIAQQLGEQGHYAKAEREFRALLADQLRVLGPDDLRTLFTRSEIAYLLGALGHYAAAEWETRAVFADQVRVMGPDHRILLGTRRQVALQQGLRGQPAQAERELRAVLADQVRLADPDDSSAVVTRQLIAWQMGEQGCHAEAERELRAVIDNRSQVLGPDHPAVLNSRHLLARQVGEQGRHAEAERELRAVLAGQLRVLSPNHPQVLITRHHIARQVGEQGRHAEAERELRAVLAGQLRVLGPDHPSTLSTRYETARRIGEQGRHAEAERELRAVLAGQLRVLGPNHPHVLITRHHIAQQ